MSYRIAVVQNESESLHYVYANVIQKLQQINRLKNYEFDRWDSHDITSLLSDQTLLSYDALFISTNATSDGSMLASLRAGRDLIEQFISMGRGVFLSYQKKLTASVNSPTSATGFLPTGLDVIAIERPEPDSAEGAISTVLDGEDGPTALNLLLHYPEQISALTIQTHCLDNDFKRHLYRAYLVPTTEGSYETLVSDRSYSDAERPLLLVNRRSIGGERVVVSTMALDWESHLRLLTNIVVFIAEGAPAVAFISNDIQRNGDFDYLVSSATLSKIPHVLYSDPTVISQGLVDTHGIYVLSPGWTDDVAADLWNRVSVQPAQRDLRRYRRLYRLDEQNGRVSLTQYSSYSSVDLTIDTALSWIDRQYSGGMWAGGFWNTYDVLMMMCDLALETGTYVSAIFEDVRKHYKNGSYDGVMGATCGLLELSVRLVGADPENLRRMGMSVEDLSFMATWILNGLPSQSPTGQHVAVLALSTYLRWMHLQGVEWQGVSSFNDHLANTPRDRFAVGWSVGAVTELDLARAIEVALICESSDDVVARLLQRLNELQASSGSWTSTGRTAHVVVSLLHCYHALVQLKNEVDINEMIYNGILHLRREYSEQAGNWSSDVQVTAKAIHAIGLHNREFSYSTQEFFQAIRGEIEHLDRSESVRTLRLEMARLRGEADENRHQVSHALTRSADLEQLASRYAESEARLTRQNFLWRVCATTSLSILIGLSASLLLNYRPTVRSLLSEVGPLLPLILGAIISVPLGILLAPKKAEVPPELAARQAENANAVNEQRMKKKTP